MSQVTKLALENFSFFDLLDEDGLGIEVHEDSVSVLDGFVVECQERHVVRKSHGTIQPEKPETIPKPGKKQMSLSSSVKHVTLTSTQTSGITRKSLKSLVCQA
jgi:hypothetical protein